MLVAEIKDYIDTEIEQFKHLEYLVARDSVVVALEYLKSMLDQLELADSDWVTDRPPKKSGEYLIINGEKKYDVRKYDDGWYHDMYKRYSNEELKVVAWKKIEPYKESE